MALISCPECGKAVSDQARACPGCGYPTSRDFSKATFIFDKSSWTCDCCIFDLNGHELSACRTGDVVSVPCFKPKTVQIKMKAGMGKPSVIIEPGKIYKAWINGMGQVMVKETGPLEKQDN